MNINNIIGSLEFGPVIEKTISGKARKVKVASTTESFWNVYRTLGKKDRGSLAANGIVVFIRYGKWLVQHWDTSGEFIVNDK